MKRLLIVLVTSFSICVSCNQVRVKPIDQDTDKIFLDTNYSYMPDFKTFNDTGKYYFFIKTWGFLKYNATIKKDVDWDNVFLKEYVKIPNISKREFNEIILSLIDKVILPAEKNTQNNVKDYALIDNSWFYDSLHIESEISRKLEYIFENRNSIPNRFVSKNSFVSNNSIGNLEFSETKYNDNFFPNENIRVLGLAKYWNIINYFYVYKNYMDKKWDDVLIECITDFKNSKNEIEYYKSVQKLSSYLNDCHSMVRSKIRDEKVLGKFVPNFRVKKINDTFAVNKFRVKEYSNYGLQIGDVVLEIDSVNIKERYDSLNQFFRGANKLSEQRIINPYLFASTKNKLHIKFLRNHSTQTKTIELKDYSFFVRNEQKNIEKYENDIVIKEISDNSIYIDLNYIFDDNFDKNFNHIEQWDNVIIDLRCYPREKVFFSLINRILPAESNFFIASYSDVTKPGVLRLHQGYKMGDNANDNYKGNVFVLVNEHTQSMSEFLVMALQASPNVTVVGSQTAGSDGNITKFHFPGKIRTIFSGIGIYYPDTTQTQRIGVKLDYEVNQTVRGIQLQKDEILDFTKELIKNGKKRKTYSSN